MTRFCCWVSGCVSQVKSNMFSAEVETRCQREVKTEVSKGSGNRGVKGKWKQRCQREVKTRCQREVETEVSKGSGNRGVKGKWKQRCQREVETEVSKGSENVERK